jgi:hypothetical protein
MFSDVQIGYLNVRALAWSDVKSFLNNLIGENHWRALNYVPRVEGCALTAWEQDSLPGFLPAFKIAINPEKVALLKMVEDTPTMKFRRVMMITATWDDQAISRPDIREHRCTMAWAPANKINPMWFPWEQPVFTDTAKAAYRAIKESGNLNPLGRSYGEYRELAGAGVILSSPQKGRRLNLKIPADVLKALEGA